LRVKVFVTPRQGILDPQGRAVEQALKSLGFDSVKGVHVGRYIVLDLQAASADEARDAARRMCNELLANPLIEDYRFEVEPG
jgi:phosphoribosylformylglycinamidine synthase